jgi:hypothetical protein
MESSVWEEGKGSGSMTEDEQQAVGCLWLSGCGLLAFALVVFIVAAAIKWVISG